MIFAVKVVIKIFGILALLFILALPSGAQDYLEGGYVGSYSGDIGQYFTDPIFRSPSPSYVSPDPAVRSMQESLDRPIAPLGSKVSQTTIGRYSATSTPVGKTTRTGAYSATSQPVAKTTLTGASGRWILQLSEGKSIYLELYQSGTRLFGRGSIVSGKTVQGALASGTATGNNIVLDVVSESGTELYSISLDMSRLNLASKYTVFRYGAERGYGTVKATRSP